MKEIFLQTLWLTTKEMSKVLEIVPESREPRMEIGFADIVRRKNDLIQNHYLVCLKHDRQSNRHKSP